MILDDKLISILNALPDPAFVLSRSGKYVAVFGGKDQRYYHDGSGLVGLYIGDLIKKDKAEFFLRTITQALASRQLEIVEYQLGNRDVKGLPEEGPSDPIWFEGRVQALDFQAEGEDVVLWVATNVSARHELEIELMELAETDHLTGFYNRRRLAAVLTEQYNLLERYGKPSSIIIVDIDDFKKINDTLGHQAGDEALIRIAGIIRTEMRSVDMAFRIGGDEYAVILPQCELSSARKFMERVYKVIQQADLSKYECAQCRLGISAGVAQMNTSDISAAETMMRADRALYRAKAMGRGRFVLDETA